MQDIDRLLSRGGMDSMLLTLWIIIGAVTFGTLMEEFGLLAKLIDPVLARAKTTGLLFATIVTTAIGLNIVAGDQYIALVLPVRMFRVEFQKRGLQPQNLSRVAADAGTVTSASGTVEFMWRVHVCHARHLNLSIFTVCHLQYCQPNSVACLRDHRFQDRAYTVHNSYL